MGAFIMTHEKNIIYAYEQGRSAFWDAKAYSFSQSELLSRFNRQLGEGCNKYNLDWKRGWEAARLQSGGTIE